VRQVPKAAASRGKNQKAQQQERERSNSEAPNERTE
jgi:hypothetical protein